MLYYRATLLLFFMPTLIFFVTAIAICSWQSISNKT